MSAKRPLLLVALATTALALGLAFTVRANLATPVAVAPVRRGTAVLTASGNVSVLPALESRVVAPAQGILKSFPHKEGSPVKKGDLIAEIDRGQWPFLLEETRIELERVNRRLEQGSPTGIELAKLRKTHENNTKAGNIPAEQLDREARDIEKLEFALRQEQTDLEYSRTKLLNKIAEISQEIDRRTLRAANDGIVMAPAVLQGDLIMHGQTLCSITGRAKMVRVEINQDDLRAAKASRRVLVRFYTEGDRVLTGKIAEIPPFGDQKTQRFQVFVDLPDLPDSILTGQTGEATFIADEHPGALLIPRKALVGSDCFVVAGDRLEKRRVKIGFTTLADAEILAGLREGDLVVVRDADLRRPGEKISIAAE